jgi:hypothetical protein
MCGAPFERHSKHAAMLAEKTLGQQTQSEHNLSTLVSLWIDHATDEALRFQLNSKNIVDTLFEELAPSISNLEELLKKLVQRGGRFSIDHTQDRDLEASQIYTEVLRSIPNSNSPAVITLCCPPSPVIYW